MKLFPRRIRSLAAWAGAALVVAALLGLAPACLATETTNHLLRIVPTPGAVSVDGDLADWDLSGGILICPNIEERRDTMSADMYGMYDDRGLYFAFRFRDPTPMRNPV